MFMAEVLMDQMTQTATISYTNGQTENTTYTLVCQYLSVRPTGKKKNTKDSREGSLVMINEKWKIKFRAFEWTHSARRETKKQTKEENGSGTGKSREEKRPKTSKTASASLKENRNSDSEPPNRSIR